MSLLSLLSLLKIEVNSSDSVRGVSYPVCTWFFPKRFFPKIACAVVPVVTLPDLLAFFDTWLCHQLAPPVPLKLVIEITGQRFLKTKVDFCDLDNSARHFDLLLAVAHATPVSPPPAAFLRSHA